MADSITGISVSPTLLASNKEGGSYEVTFSNMPSGGLSWNITYNSDTDWITEVIFNNNIATVTIEENIGTMRSAVIRFYDTANNSDYIDLPIVQKGEGFNCIWLDKTFEPLSFKAGENYHYRLQDHSTNKIIYEGITVPISDTEKPLGINIPRLTDSYIHSDAIDDLMIKFHKIYESYFGRSYGVAFVPNRIAQCAHSAGAGAAAVGA